MNFKKFLSIDSELLDYLNEVERYFSIKIDDKLINKILDDSQTDQVTEKKYQIFDSGKSRITIDAIVDEYEPETIWIEMKNIENGDIKHFDSFVSTRTT